MILGLSGYRAMFPTGICGRFGMADVNGPIRRQRNLFEHRAIEPDVITINPELRMADAGFLEPIPGFGSPEAAVAVAAGRNEAEEFLIRDVKGIDREFRHEYRLGLEFIIPTERAVTRSP